MPPQVSGAGLIADIAATARHQPDHFRAPPGDVLFPTPCARIERH
jgi:hypothetical protein